MNILFDSPLGYIRKRPHLVVLLLIIFYFLFFSILLINKLEFGLPPDEEAHFLFSKHFSTTLGIPEDTIETFSVGWYIKQNPYLNHWINGKIINFVYFIFPLASEAQIILALRVVGLIYSLLTILFCYLISKELIQGKFWQILPIFLLTNTLMFVSLSSSISYDNSANFLSTAGLFFYVRALKNKNFTENSLLWMIFICLGTLTKMTIVPLALAMVLLYFFYIFRKRAFFSKPILNKKNTLFLILLFILIIMNLRIYGINIIRYGSLIPDCEQIASKAFCELSPFQIRLTEIGLEHKLSVFDSIQLGYPQPITYFFDSWINHMMIRTYGILGHQVYYPHLIIIFYKLLFNWTFVMAIKYWNKPSLLVLSILSIFLFYVGVVFITNYNSELTYGFKQIAIQGRYIFPVISIFYVLLTYTLIRIKHSKIKLLTLAYTLILFILGGPIKFIHPSYSNIFSNWFR